ncbi:MAG: MlaE family ABC transporter permease [Bdellovibrionia bacterium]
MRRFIQKATLDLLHEFGGIAIFSFQVLKRFASNPKHLNPILGQVASISLRSIPTVAFSGVFVGAILVLQFGAILAKYDAQSFLGGINTSALVRSVGPLIISFLLAGKVGAYTAAELGTMRVTEQIDAIECLGVDSLEYLIVPRFMGILISSAILLALGLLISIAGSMAVASLSSGVNFLEFASSIPKFTSWSTFVGGLLKAITYGAIVAAVSCYQGYTATGGARGVGRAVTLASVYTNFYIVIANYLTSELFQGFLTLGESLQIWIHKG